MMNSVGLQTGSSYSIIYTNADGMTSERDITVRAQWTNYSHEYIRAYCWSRNEDRTFRVDRIDSFGKILKSENTTPAYSSRYVPMPAGYQQPPVPTYRPPSAAEAVPSKPRASVTQTEYRRPRRSHPVVVTLSLLFVIFAFYAGSQDNADSSRSYITPAKAAAPVRTVKPLPQKTPAWEQALQLRMTHYSLVTGFSNERLLGIYSSADLNYDNVLSWQEIDLFQRKINRSFRYIQNDTALTPIDFLASGGGDCEDWALFTCGMLKFWDYTAYVGVVDGGNNTGAASHAIALFYKKTPPANPGYRYYSLTEPYSFYNITLPAGCYLPIDYDHAGSFSNASRPDSPLRNVYRPEEIYGRYM